MDQILSQSKQLAGRDFNVRRFHPLLLSDKRTSSRTATHVYRTPWTFLGSARSQQLISTLVSSAMGKTSIPYHLYLESLQLQGRGSVYTGDIAELQNLVDKVQHRRLRDLSLAFPEHLALLESFEKHDALQLESLSLRFEGEQMDGSAQSAIKAFTSRLCVEDLDVNLKGYPDHFEVCELQDNSLKNLSLHGHSPAGGRVITTSDRALPRYFSRRSLRRSRRFVYAM